MRFLAECLLLITTAYITSIQAAVTSPPQNLNQIGVNPNISSLGSNPECFPPALVSSRRARYTDCALATAHLPYYHNPGTFHTGGPQDRFQLPQRKVVESCQVVVDIRSYENRDESSWMVVHAAANGVLNGCMSGYGSFAETGGEIYMGTERRIRVTIEKARVIGGWGNLTTSR